MSSFHSRILVIAFAIALSFQSVIPSDDEDVLVHDALTAKSFLDDERPSAIGLLPAKLKMCTVVYVMLSGLNIMQVFAKNYLNYMLCR